MFYVYINFADKWDFQWLVTNAESFQQHGTLCGPGRKQGEQQHSHIKSRVLHILPKTLKAIDV